MDKIEIRQEVNREALQRGGGNLIPTLDCSRPLSCRATSTRVKGQRKEYESRDTREKYQSEEIGLDAALEVAHRELLELWTHCRQLVELPRQEHRPVAQVGQIEHS